MLEVSAGGEDVAEVLGHAFVDPKKGALLRLFEVGLVEVEGATVLAVPGVGELVGEEVGLGELVLGVGEVFFADAVVGGLAVLEAFAAGDVREGEQEVVLVVVMRSCRGRQPRGRGWRSSARKAGRRSESSGRSETTSMKWAGLIFGGEGELVEVLAGDDGGVFELLDGGGGVAGGCGLRARGVIGLGDAGFGGGGAGTDGREGGADAPAFGGR